MLLVAAAAPREGEGQLLTGKGKVSTAGLPGHDDAPNLGLTRWLLLLLEVEDDDDTRVEAVVAVAAVGRLRFCPTL